MIVGPLFHRELATTPRRVRFFVDRCVYATALLILMSTAWAVVAGAQSIRCVGDMARFGLMLFQILAPLQLALIVFFSAMTAASAVALEKDKRTLTLLLMTRMSNWELVLGKMMASLLHVFVLIAAALPILLMVTLFGGVAVSQVVATTAVTVVTAIAAASLGVLIAFWRDKTFQSLALTALIVVLWIGLWEAIGAADLESYLGFQGQAWAATFSPLRAIREAARPVVASDAAFGPWAGSSISYLVAMSVLSLSLIGIAVARVRVWNPSRQLRAVTPAMESEGPPIEADRAREGHVDARLRASAAGRSRTVWDNPVLWREVCTWAYGRKVMAVRFVYLAMVILVVLGVTGMMSTTAPPPDRGAVIPAAANWLTPLFLVSVVIVNALAVTSVTNERDGQSLDLLLATDLSPGEFVFGKLAGVLSVAGLMVLSPLLLCLVVWWRGTISGENLLYVLGGLIVVDVFAAMLGVHCGMRYANSRTAIGVSLGTVFFLFLGVATCVLMLISFSGSFEIQLAPFLAFIVGGGVGLFVSLGAGNPSKAIAAASMLVPFATFYCITSFLLGHSLSVFLVMATTYGFATAAMLIPALFEFDFAMGRTSTAEE